MHKLPMLMVALLVLASMQACAFATTVWPMPSAMTQTATQYQLAPAAIFQWSVQGSSPTLTAAIQRYQSLVFFSGGDSLPAAAAATGLQTLTGITIDVTSSDTTLNSSTVESYSLHITAPVAVIMAPTVYGALHALETFSQVVQHIPNTSSYIVNQTSIIDSPRFSWRGVLVDTSRHWLSVEVLMAHVDAMAYNKYNVLHWHIVDDQSFPYVSMAFPNLSRDGAYDPTHIYSPADVQDLIEYAQSRGVRVVVEFDTPGHTLSWGPGQPGLLTPCYTGTQANGQYGPVNPILPSTYSFMQVFWHEVAKVFVDNYVHVGGDEVIFDCWQSNPDITAYMSKHNYSGNYALLEQFYENSVLQIVESTGKSYIAWEDVFDNGCKLNAQTVIEVWKDWGAGWQATIANVTAHGYKSILSAPWYMNYIVYGTGWQTYYETEPLNWTGTAAQKDLVLGGEASFWGEFIDNTNAISTAWPRASAVAERLWSPESVTDLTSATLRIQEQQCRLMRRGIQAEPMNGPSFCAEEFDYAYSPPWEQQVSRRQKVPPPRIVYA